MRWIGIWSMRVTAVEASSSIEEVGVRLRVIVGSAGAARLSLMCSLGRLLLSSIC